MIIREKDKQQLLAIASRTLHTPLEIWVYGSRVNGDAHDTSDLDLVIRTQNLSRLHLWGGIVELVVGANGRSPL